MILIMFAFLYYYDFSCTVFCFYLRLFSGTQVRTVRTSGYAPAVR